MNPGDQYYYVCYYDYDTWWTLITDVLLWYLVNTIIIWPLCYYVCYYDTRWPLTPALTLLLPALTSGAAPVISAQPLTDGMERILYKLNVENNDHQTDKTPLSLMQRRYYGSHHRQNNCIYVRFRENDAQQVLLYDVEPSGVHILTFHYWTYKFLEQTKN